MGGAKNAFDPLQSGPSLVREMLDECVELRRTGHPLAANFERSRDGTMSPELVLRLQKSAQWQTDERGGVLLGRGFHVGFGIGARPCVEEPSHPFDNIVPR